jgi:hypothetical protein
MPIPVATQSKAWLCDRLLAGIVSSNPTSAWIILSVGSVVCWHVEVPESVLSVAQRSPINCGVSECDCEAP